MPPINAPSLQVMKNWYYRIPVIVLFTVFVTYNSGVINTIFTARSSYNITMETVSTSKVVFNSKPIEAKTTPKYIRNSTERPTRMAYHSVKPKHCEIYGARPKCLLPGNKLTGVNQHHDLSQACYPQEVMQSPIKPYLDRNFTPPILKYENETLHDPVFEDILKTTNAKFSKFHIIDAKKLYSVGDVIKVRIDMADGYKRKRTIGGDDVRISVRSLDNKFASAGEITDLKNGTYIGEIKVLWAGKSKIYVMLYNTREALATQFRWRREYKELFFYYAHFSNGKTSEYTLCSILSPVHGYKKLCNLTSLNRGHSWFCGHPLKPELKCEHVELIHAYDFLEIPMTSGQHEYFNRFTLHRYIAGNVVVDVKQGTKKTHKKEVLCNKLPRAVTWDTRMPSGFFGDGRWNSLRCRNDVTKGNFLSRLKNVTLIVGGDSTTRRWYTYFRNNLKCQQETKAWDSSKWYERASCVLKSLNFRFIWSPHELPFYTAIKRKDGQLSLYSTRHILDEVPTTGKYIVVLHYYAHYIRQHYSIFLDVTRSLKPAIRAALKRNPDLKIAIKAPHSFHSHDCVSHINDFIGPYFTDILKSELKEFRDSVWLLNYWDITVAIENKDLHPVYSIVWENIRQMFGYTLV